MRTLAKQAILLLLCGVVGIVALPVFLAGGACVGALTCAGAGAFAWRELAQWFCNEEPEGGEQ